MMDIEFTFIDGPMQGITFAGPADGDSEASNLYLITDNGTVGREFTTISERGRQAIAEMESNSGAEFGGPYEYYRYRVDRCSGDDSGVQIRATFVNRVPFGFHSPGSMR